MTGNSSLFHHNPIKDVSGLDDLLAGDNFIPTCSVVYRKSSIGIPDWFSKVPFGDYALHIIAASTGKIKYINEVMGVYRIHQSGIHGFMTGSNKGLTEAYIKHFKFWKVIIENDIADKKKVIKPLLRSINLVISFAIKSSQPGISIQFNLYLLRYGGMSNLRSLFRNLKQAIAVLI